MVSVSIKHSGIGDIPVPVFQFDRGNGGPPAPVATGICPPVPATGTWGMIALLGLLMVGSLFFMRRRSEG